MSFSQISSRLQKELRSNNPQIRFLLKKNPGLAFTTINEIATDIGKKYKIRIALNFPERGKIEDYESYGTENIGFVFEADSKTFCISRELIKSKASEFLGKVKIQDAYMYEGKEGVRVVNDSYRLDILPASLHIWGKINQEIRSFCDWLLEKCYGVEPILEGTSNETNS
jgi:hypothetical protein